MAVEESIRLQKYLARCGLASRRKAEQFILAGRVSVDGKCITKLGTSVTPGREVVRFDNKVVTPEENLVYFLLNKPKGYVTTLSDPQGRPVVTSLITNCKERLFPVGRLDFDTEGALLLTNDGNLAQKIQHPSHETNKTYEAWVHGQPTQNNLNKLTIGILLEGKKTSPASLKLLTQKNKTSLVRITIHEGRKHQVKKMFKAIGHPVTALKRIAYGKLTLKNLPLGENRKLTAAELKKIFL